MWERKKEWRVTLTCEREQMTRGRFSAARRHIRDSLETGSRPIWCLACPSRRSTRTLIQSEISWVQLSTFDQDRTSPHPTEPYRTTNEPQPNIQDCTVQYGTMYSLLFARIAPTNAKSISSMH